MLRLAVLLLCAAARLGAAEPPPLVPPDGFRAAVQQGAGGGAGLGAVPPPFTGDLAFVSKYGRNTPANDSIDAAAEAEYERQVAPIVAFRAGVVRAVDLHLAHGDPRDLAAAVAWLEAWAAADALTGTSRSITGWAQRNWTLAAVGSAWLRLHASVSAPLAGVAPERTAAVAAWLGRLAARAMAEQRWPPEKHNNHQYWAACAVQAVAVLRNDRHAYGWALDILRTAMAHVDADGHLPNELARRSRALAYHSFALEPLMAVAAVARANHEDAAAWEGPLLRLAHRTLADADDPAAIAALVGTPQSWNPGKPMPWLEPYAWLFPGEAAAVAARLRRHRPLVYDRLGGDLTRIYHAAPRAGDGARTTP